jgi:ABC-type dipeptide/oligopeptide/nickel transport system permease component
MWLLEDDSHMGSLIPFVIVRCLLSVILTAAAVGALIWFAPGRDFTHSSLHGFGADASGLSDESASVFVWKYCRGLLSGDAGVSTSFQAPVAPLIRERFRTSAMTVIRSFLILIVVSSLLAGLSLRSPVFRAAARLLTGILYSIPVGVLALPLVYLELPSELAVVAGSLPKAFSLFDAVLERFSSATHLLWMRSMGVGWLTVFCYGILRAARSELLEIVALCVPLLLGSLIVVEVVSGQAGVGSLAWRAVQGRDLPLLGAITVVFAIASSLAAAGAALCARGGHA